MPLHFKITLNFVRLREILISYCNSISCYLIKISTNIVQNFLRSNARSIHQMETPEDERNLLHAWKYSRMGLKWENRHHV